MQRSDYSEAYYINFSFLTKDERIMPTLTKGAGFVLRHKGDFIFPHIDPSLTDLPHLKMIIKKE